jgi:hypothetical protein
MNDDYYALFEMFLAFWQCSSRPTYCILTR